MFCILFHVHCLYFLSFKGEMFCSSKQLEFNMKKIVKSCRLFEIFYVFTGSLVFNFSQFLCDYNPLRSLNRLIRFPCFPFSLSFFFSSCFPHTLLYYSRFFFQLSLNPLYAICLKILHTSSNCTKCAFFLFYLLFFLRPYLQQVYYLVS